jgi:hypothetical protein
MGTFKIWFVAAISRFQKWFDVDDSDFQIELCGQYFGIFYGLKTVLATFWKNLANFKIIWSL